jgi:uncharacterized protein (TIGR02145 family)
MKKILLTLVILGFYTIANAQVKVNQNAANSAINTSSAFMDASSSPLWNGTTNQGKGMLYPRVDLVNYTAMSHAGPFNASNNPNYFDGLLVFNTATGVAGIGADSVFPGYYYYRNTTATANGGHWVSLKGIKGDDGSIGPIGLQGVQGIAGNDGAAGAIGLTGATGPSGLLSSGTAAGNTPYWNGTNWILNGTNFYNNGSNIGIGTTTPNASAIAEMNSTNQGFLPPRMTTTQRNAIVSPASGLQIYNSTTGCLNFYSGSAWYEVCGTIILGTFPAGTVNCAGVTAVVDVTSPTGKIWMDRNLGASQVATSSTDAAAYGDLYQWGRRADGHQCRTSATTATLSSIDQPANGNFILAPSAPFDWRSPQNVNLWQGVNGVNNPCPGGYRLPTDMELDAERASFISQNSSGAFASPLKFTQGGLRSNIGGLFNFVGSSGFYWSSSISGTETRRLGFSSGVANLNPGTRADGYSVRCIKD